MSAIIDAAKSTSGRTEWRLDDEGGLTEQSPQSITFTLTAANTRILLELGPFMMQQRRYNGGKVSLMAATNNNTSSNYRIDFIICYACCVGYLGRIQVKLELDWLQWKHPIK